MSHLVFAAVSLFFLAANVQSPDAGEPAQADASIAEVVPDATAPIAPLRKSSSRADVEIRHMHMVVDRKGGRISVSQMITLGTNGVRFENNEGYPISFPRGALAPRIIEDEHGEYLASKIVDGSFVVTEPIMPGGGDVTIAFEVPINDEVAVIDQKFMGDISTGQVVLTWTKGDTRIEAGGLGEAKATALQSGMMALVAMGRDVPGRPFAVRITGLASGDEESMRYGTMAACVLLLAGGLFFWARRKKRGNV